MRLFNQSKNDLRWDMSGLVYECEPWGSVDVPEEFLDAVKSRGLPLDIVPVAPELRAQVRIADERAVADQAPILALRKEADESAAKLKQAMLEVELRQSELAETRVALTAERKLTAELRDKLARLESDKQAADTLLSESSAQATASEARAIKAEALLAEATKPAKSEKKRTAEA